MSSLPQNVESTINDTDMRIVVIVPVIPDKPPGMSRLGHAARLVFLTGLMIGLAAFLHASNLLTVKLIVGFAALAIVFLWVFIVGPKSIVITDQCVFVVQRGRERFRRKIEDIVAIRGGLPGWQRLIFSDKTTLWIPSTGVEGAAAIDYLMHRSQDPSISRRDN